MKMFTAMLAFSLVFVGCGDESVDAPITQAEEQDTVDGVSNGDVVQENSEDVLSVDSSDDVSILDVDIDDEEIRVEDSADVVEEKDLDELEEDPTNFRDNSIPGSRFFNPEIP